MERIYLDHAATTPLHSKAYEAMRPWLEKGFGNPSSLYQEGREARQAIDQAREDIAQLLGCEFGEVTFTSSGTEAANLAMLGAVLAHRDSGRKRILIGAAEHHCVLESRELLESLGYKIELVAVDAQACIRMDDLEHQLGDDVLLVAVMHANNELGTIQPAAEVGVLARAHGALYFCDAVQTFCALPWMAQDLDADLISISAHKVYGPKGVGALYVRAGVRLKPILVGGGQERELRAGTENVAAIVGFAAAAVAVSRADQNRERRARDAFYQELANSGAPEWHRTIQPETDCLSGHAHLRFTGISAESMLILLDRMGVSASSGAACSSGSLEPSHVLLAAGFSETQAKEGLRFTFGLESTAEQAREAARRVSEAAKTIRKTA